MGGIRDHGGIILWFKNSSTTELFNNRIRLFIVTGYCNEDGYGQVQYPMTLKEKFTLTGYRGKWYEIPEGLCICLCVNHLFVGSRADNNKDMTKKGLKSQ